MSSTITNDILHSTNTIKTQTIDHDNVLSLQLVKSLSEQINKLNDKVEFLLSENQLLKNKIEQNETVEIRNVYEKNSNVTRCIPINGVTLLFGAQYGYEGEEKYGIRILVKKSSPFVSTPIVIPQEINAKNLKKFLYFNPNKIQIINDHYVQPQPGILPCGVVSVFDAYLSLTSDHKFEEIIVSFTPNSYFWDILCKYTNYKKISNRMSQDSYDCPNSFKVHCQKNNIEYVFV